MISGYKTKRKWNWKLWSVGAEGMAIEWVVFRKCDGIRSERNSPEFSAWRVHLKSGRVKPRFAAVLTSKDVDKGKKAASLSKQS